VLPDLESLRCFEAAAVQLNFRAAAAAVALSPAAFGDRIKRLEDQIGKALFQRTTRRVVLTAEGEKLLPQVRRTLEEARRCLDITGEGRIPFELTVGTRFELGLSWLTPSLTRLNKARPERTLHLHFGDSPELLAGARRGAIDCAVTSARLTGGDFRYDLLHEEQYAFVGTSAVLKASPLRQASDARGHVLLDLHPDLPLFRYLLDARPGGEPWDFSRIEYLGTIGAVRHRVLEGAGVAVLPRYFIEKDLDSGKLKELMPKVPLQRDHFRLIWRAGHPREDEFHRLAAELRDIPLR
jgi:LysR family transcriptional regulator, glycine cleavage system transcriptional activator